MPDNTPIVRAERDLHAGEEIVLGTARYRIVTDARTGDLLYHLDGGLQPWSATASTPRRARAGSPTRTTPTTPAAPSNEATPETTTRTESGGHAPPPSLPPSRKT